MKSTRIMGPALAFLLVVGVGSGIWYSNQQLRLENAQPHDVQEVVVRGLIGSEKQAFFQDERVVQAFRKHGISVIVDKAGSRSIATRTDYQSYDFGFPSGANTGAQLKKIVGAKDTYVPFYTPMVVASWRPIADILVANDIVHKENDIYYINNLSQLLTLIEQQKRWKDLQKSEAFPTSKSILIASTDVRTSNSAMMYLALASYTLNGDAIVQSPQEVDRIIDRAADLFLRQGFQEASSAAPFEDYLALGMGKSPLLLAYESQLLEYWYKRPERLNSDMVMLYPKPTVFSKHVFVPFNEKGMRVGEALESDSELQSLAHDYGFRTGGEQKGPELWAQKGIVVPTTLVDVIDPPSYEWMEAMITAIEQKFQ